MRPSRPLVEGIDYTWDGDRMIFTREFLLERGYCCNSRCRNCPYKDGEKPKIQEVE